MTKKLLKNLILGVAFSLQGLLVLNAQTSQDISNNLSQDARVNSFTMEPNRGTPSLIKLNTTGATLQLNDTPAFLNSVLGMGQETTFSTLTTTNTNGVQVTKFQQYTKGVKVEHGVFKAMSKNNVVFGLTAEYYNLSDSINSVPSLSESAALQLVLNHVGATTYAWEYIQSLGNSPEITAAYNEVYPKGELVFVDNYLTDAIDLSLAYKFNIYAAEPLSRADIYIDAVSGQVLLLDAIIKHVDGKNGKEMVKNEIKPAAKPSFITKPAVLAATGETRYAGNRTFQTSYDSETGYYVLAGTSPSGVENETLSYEGFGGLPINAPISGFAVPIYDGDGELLYPESADNIWNAFGEHRKSDFSTPYTPTVPFTATAGQNEANNDDVALDAHWSTEIVLDYWKNVHNRLSYDDQGTKVTNYVHYGDAYDNAFWNGTAMTYGDGSYQGGTHPDGSFAPLTSMDVCAHEIGHGVCTFTADLVYQRESGALNEGFSDIWGAAVEAYVLDEIDDSLEYDPWGIGEQVDERDGGLAPGSADSRALRWMDDPNAAGDPDSYGGTNWIEPECGTPTLANDQCGVHTNSGVLNKWYYFLVTGSGKSFTPGYNKASADDGISDGGNVYTVEGIGFINAAKIAYLAETMLSPNAKFIEMRDASILAAQMLFGLGSNEEIQTTNSWFAVDIGEAYSTGEPNTIVFNDKNVSIFGEDNAISGCDDSNLYSVYISGVEVDPSQTINISTAGSTATLGVDYDLSTRTLTFNGSELKPIDIVVYDDDEIEDDEIIVLSYTYNGEVFTQQYSIADNDYAPRTGNQPFDLLATETFDNSEIPAGWDVISYSDGNIWKFNGLGSATGTAYIAADLPGANTPFYDQTVATNIILRSPMLNAGAASDVTVTFDWEAGGETEEPLSETLFDYGEFMYSLDGSNFVSVEHFHGSGPIGGVTDNGSYTGVISELDGQAFFIGWRWFNDTLAGGSFSFTIDNVNVKATPAGIETEEFETSTSHVYAGSSVYFMSDSDDGLIARIDNASEDIGCVTMTVIDEGNSFELFPNLTTVRTDKAYSIFVANEDATYDLTLYYTETELNAFGDAVLVPMMVDSADLNDATENPNNMQYNGALSELNEGDAFRAYTGTFKGSGKVTLVEEFNYTPVEEEEEEEEETNYEKCEKYRLKCEAGDTKYCKKYEKCVAEIDEEENEEDNKCEKYRLKCEDGNAKNCKKYEECLADNEEEEKDDCAKYRTKCEEGDTKYCDKYEECLAENGETEDDYEDEYSCTCSKHEGRHSCDDKNENHYVRGSQGNYNAFVVSPNPAVTSVNVTSDANIVSFAVYNLYGVLVNSGSMTAVNNLNLQVNNLEAGMYIIKIIDDKAEMFDLKFIKM